MEGEQEPREEVKGVVQAGVNGGLDQSCAEGKDTGAGPGGVLEDEMPHLGGGDEGSVVKTPRFLAEETGDRAAIS